MDPVFTGSVISCQGCCFLLLLFVFFFACLYCCLFVCFALEPVMTSVEHMYAFTMSRDIQSPDAQN